MLFRRILLIIVAAVFAAAAEELPIVDKVDAQPLFAQAARVVQALELTGEPLPPAVGRTS